MKHSVILNTLFLGFFIGFIVEMVFLQRVWRKKTTDAFKGVFNQEASDSAKVSHDSDMKNVGENDKSYVSGVYYSNWSPFPPRSHFPHDVNLERITHLYYSFFIIDQDTGECKSSDEWSDFQMDTYKDWYAKSYGLHDENRHHSHDAKEVLPMGCLGELFYLRKARHLSKLNITDGAEQFSTILSIGGWSNRQAFPVIVRDKNKMGAFIRSAVESMVKYGFDGIDIDWEFPRNDGIEPQAYCDLMSSLKEALSNLEKTIFGADSENHFLLTTAIPALVENLEFLPLSQVDEYVDYWNLMAYDFSGSWSSKTAYHSSLFASKNDQTTPCTDMGVRFLIDQAKVPSRKIVLGMPAYGRGFTRVKLHAYDEPVIGHNFKGVGGASEGEPGIWQYNQLPLNGTEEQFDADAVSAYSIDVQKRTLVVYDNTESMKRKAQYVMDNNLAGGFWWESCGDYQTDKSRSLIVTFTDVLPALDKKPSIFTRTEMANFYAAHYPSELLSQILK
ncbi:LAMI_0E13960g1_1 [Lachancea mirantina]|uniref:chitinase n=1 Tax=Lachancea mirantina TaxID=1230905 RepID=A0A1G4JR69_9SACH|nr:LAMI_0E13960g1_1 [Lachancea mirantina]